MIIKDSVKQAIAAMPGNQTFSSITIADLVNESNPDRAITPEQVGRAIRDLPYVARKHGYRVKGRRVPQR